MALRATAIPTMRYLLWQVRHLEERGRARFDVFF